MRYLAQCGNFFRECRSHFHTTGAVLPSSRFLARALVSELCKPRGPSRILEVGPGTGSVTKKILDHLQPGDQFDAVEINGHFFDILRRRLATEWAFHPFSHQVRLIHAAVEDVPGERGYDYIVSGLPLNNFPVSLVRRIFRAYDRLLKPGGTLTYYEYVFIRQLKTPFASRRERRRLHCLGRVVGDYIQNFQVRRESILINVPPRHRKALAFPAERSGQQFAPAPPGWQAAVDRSRSPLAPLS